MRSQRACLPDTVPEGRCCGVNRFQHFRHDSARMDGIDPDVFGSQLDRRVFRKRTGSALGRTVGGVSAVSVTGSETPDRVNIDDGALSGFFHVRDSCLDAKHYRKAVCLVYAEEFLGAGIEYALHCHDGRVVYNDIHTAVFFECCLSNSFPFFLVRHIMLKGGHFVIRMFRKNLRERVFHFLHMTAGACHVGAFLRKEFRNRQAKPLTCAGDDGCLACKSAHYIFSSFEL